jgi:hypothetical protein
MKCFFASRGWPSQKFSGEFGTQEAGAASPCPVENQHGVAHDSVRIAPGRAQRPVMHFHFRKRFAGGEPEIPQDGIALERLRIVGGSQRRQQPETSENQNGDFHRTRPFG